MSNEKKELWLVIERYGYSNSDTTPTHSVKKTAYSTMQNRIPEIPENPENPEFPE